MKYCGMFDVVLEDGETLVIPHGTKCSRPQHIEHLANLEPNKSYSIIIMENNENKGEEK